MSCEKRISIVDGSVEVQAFHDLTSQEAALSLLAALVVLDPFRDAKQIREERTSLIDGTVEEVEFTVLPAFPKLIYPKVGGKNNE